MSRAVGTFVIDGSAAARRLVREAVATNHDVRVVGSASSVEAATHVASPGEVDLIVLGCDGSGAGTGAIAEARRIAPRASIVLFGVARGPRSRAAAEALAAGADEYVEKPDVALEWRTAVAETRRSLVPRLLAVARGSSNGPKVPTSTTLPSVSAVQVRMRRTSGTEIAPPIEVLAIGASTGGPEALAAFFGELPHIDVPVVLVQHMPASFVALLAARLDRNSTLSVREATHGAHLQSGVVLIAPGDMHMRVVLEGGVPCVALDQSPPECSCRPAVDPLFRSVARVFGPRCLAVVLTGMGQDGLDGCRAIRAAGGGVLVQDEATSIVWGMPGQVARAGLADDVLPLGALASAVVQRLGRRLTHRTLGAVHGS